MENSLELKKILLVKFIQQLLEIYEGFYPEIKNNKDFILRQFNNEEEKFEKTFGKRIKRI